MPEHPRVRGVTEEELLDRKAKLLLRHPCLLEHIANEDLCSHEWWEADELRSIQFLLGER